MPSAATVDAVTTRTRFGGRRAHRNTSAWRLLASWRQAGAVRWWSVPRRLDTPAASTVVGGEHR
jgi:hypothetical protein